MGAISSITQSKVGKGILLVAGVVAVVFCVFQFKSMFGQSSDGVDSSTRWFVCSETHKPFRKKLQIGDNIPVVSPYSGKETGYPAELCYWTKEGTVKKDPTPVLLNSYVGDNSPTFCPDCGRLVVGRNPTPDPEKPLHPPPTKEEWEARHAGP